MCIRDSNGTTRMIGKARAAGSPIAEGSNEKVGWGRISPVSYTHLDVYKRQEQFDLDTSLYKRINTIPSIDFNGVLPNAG